MKIIHACILVAVLASFALTYYFLSQPLYVSISFDVERDPLALNKGEVSFEGVKVIPKILGILEAHNASATFFVTGRVADLFPDILRETTERGNELAVHGGYYHDQKIAGLPRASQKKAILDTKARIEEIDGEVVGYRSPGHLLDAETLHALEELGFEYDSSVVPSVVGWYLYRHALYVTASPYHPDYKNPFVGGDMALLEIPITPVFLNGNLDSLLGYQGTAITKLELFASIVECKLRNRPLVVYLHPGLFVDLPNEPLDYGTGSHILKEFDSVLSFLDSFNTHYITLRELS